MRQITIYMALVLSILGSGIAAAQEPFNGLVTTPEGKGIKARIVVEGEDKWTIADGKGRFGLTDIRSNDVLLVIYRRDTRRVELDGHRSAEIVWSFGKEAQVSESTELMNYGFGYVKRRESVDFSSGISGDRLRATGCSNLQDAIMLCYPGLRYINGELCLMTKNSIDGNSSPLILCDGMETRLELINVFDVKSVEIIKGSNMYGFRGVNGVILITTMTAEDALKRTR